MFFKNPATGELENVVLFDLQASWQFMGERQNS